MLILQELSMRRSAVLSVLLTLAAVPLGAQIVEQVLVKTHLLEASA